MKDKVLIVDSLNQAYRSNITFGSGKSGKQTILQDAKTKELLEGYIEEENTDKVSYTAVFNFFRNLRALIEQFDPDKVFFALEGNSCFRYDIFSEYKANRRLIKVAQEDKFAKREDFLRQYGIMLKLLRHLPIIQVKSDRYEADDVAATLVSSLRDEEVIVISSDKDYTQLLQMGYENVKVYSHQLKNFVVSPEYHFRTFLALNGDTSDNIPSLLSKKKATAIASDPKLLAEYLSVEEQRANYNLNRQLVEMVVIDDDALEFIDYNTDFDALREKFEYMEFATILEEKYWNRFVETFERLG